MIPKVILSLAYKGGGKGNPDWYNTDVGPMMRLSISKAIGISSSTFTSRLDDLKKPEDIINNPAILRPSDRTKATKFKDPDFVYKRSARKSGARERKTDMLNLRVPADFLAWKKKRADKRKAAAEKIRQRDLQYQAALKKYAQMERAKVY